MPICKDDAVSQLNSIGYDVVRLPRADIRPLDVVVEHGAQFTRLAQLPNLWLSAAVVPEPSEAQLAPNIKSVKTSQLKGQIGVKALIDVVGKIALQVSGKRQSSMQLVAQDPTVISCPLDKLADYVREGEIDPAKTAGEFLLDDTNRIWIVTEVIQSGKLQIVVGDRNEAEATAKAAELTGNLSATAEVLNVSSSGNTITYNRKTPLVFGFKTAEIVYESGWRLELPSLPGKKFMGGATDVTEPAGVRAAGRRLALADAE